MLTTLPRGTNVIPAAVGGGIVVNLTVNNSRDRFDFEQSVRSVIRRLNNEGFFDS